jgi:hypothetical protein
MMIEKWHTAYVEAQHVPVVVQFPVPAGHVHPRRGRFGAPEPKQLDALTSHIDILPTMLGFAGVDATQRRAISAQLAQTRPVPPLPGVDLSAFIGNAMTGNGMKIPIVEPHGDICEGVLFITDDEITGPLPPSRTAQEKHSYEEFAVYQAVVEAVREGKDGKGPVDLSPGLVNSPITCPASAPGTKSSRAISIRPGKAPQEWEMYDLRSDPIEAVNLVEVTTTPPRVRSFLPHAEKMQVVAGRPVGGAAGETGTPGPLSPGR